MSEVNTCLEIRGLLRSSVSNKFNTSRASQSLVFSDTQLATVHSRTGLSFQLRYCPTLSKKPTDNKHPPSSSESSGPPKKRVDPFEDPSPDLLVARIPHSDRYTHNLVLNKFPVIANHFILATRDNKSQTHLLEPTDLELTYACLQAWHDDPHATSSDLYAFFNSGQYSGASQPHRHLQLLPVEDMQEIQVAGRPQSSPEWMLLCDQMSTLAHPNLPLYHNPDLPIVHLSTPLSSTLTPSELHQRYLMLLNAAYLITTPVSSERTSPQSPSPLSVSSLDSAAVLSPSTTHSLVSPAGEILFSYNLAMTRSTMAILPRQVDNAIIPGLPLSSVSINGTILAGTLMVKNDDEWRALKSRPEALDDLLCQVGIPVSDQQPKASAPKSQWKV